MAPRIAMVIGLLAVAALWSVVPRTIAAAQGAERVGPLASVRHWAIQLQKPDVATLAASPHDLLVIDPSRDAEEEQSDTFTAAEIKRIKQGPAGKRRIVLAYLSIGEAEVYRDYWRWYWGGAWYSRPIGWFFAPGWLGPENRQWRGNFAVRYWDADWQRRILGPAGLLDRILSAGFDGVYLDKIDSSIEAIARNRPTAKADMRDLVRRIAEMGRAIRPGFLVVPQNGEELLDDPAYLAIIDAVAKEDLLYGEVKEKVANPEILVDRRTALLRRAVAVGKTVLALEYLDQPATVAAARSRLESLGFIPYFGDRDLATLRYDVQPLPPAGKR